MKGRKKIPDQLKILKGTDQPCRMNDAPDISAISKMPPPPPWLSKSAKKVYKTKSDILASIRVLTPLDIEMFISFCHEFGRYIDTAEKLAEVSHSAILAEKPGELYERLTRINRDAFDRAKQLAGEFGLSPVARLKIASGEHSQKPKLEDILR